MKEKESPEQLIERSRSAELNLQEALALFEDETDSISLHEDADGLEKMVSEDEEAPQHSERVLEEIRQTAKNIRDTQSDLRGAMHNVTVGDAIKTLIREYGNSIAADQINIATATDDQKVIDDVADYFARAHAKALTKGRSKGINFAEAKLYGDLCAIIGERLLKQAIPPEKQED